MLAPNAKAASLMLVSSWYAFLAKPTFARSRKARIYISSRNGSSRRVTLAMVAAETGPGVANGIDTGVDTISTLLILLCHIWAGSERVPTEAAGTSLKAASQGCRKPSPHACDRVRHVALRPDRGRRAVDNRREGQTSRVVRSATRNAYAAMHKVAWWWKPRQPRPS